MSHADVMTGISVFYLKYLFWAADSSGFTIIRTNVVIVHSSLSHSVGLHCAMCCWSKQKHRLTEEEKETADHSIFVSRTGNNLSEYGT